MVTNQEDVFYYITLMNENYEHPPMPKVPRRASSRGCTCSSRRSRRASRGFSCSVPGTILREVEAPAQLLESDWDVGRRCLERDELHRAAARRPCRRALEPAAPERRPRVPYVTKGAAGQPGPVDRRERLHQELRRADPSLRAAGRSYKVLGTDGFGRSDSRARLRYFFEVNRHFVTVAALKSLADQGELKAKQVAEAIKKYGIDPEKADPATA
jgi:pyruvate dehydrogenase E1 component